jgi:hypothetical protein
MLEIVVYRNPGNVFAGIAREQAELGQQAPEIVELGAQQAPTLWQRHLRKCNFKIPQADAPHSRVEKIHGATDRDTNCPRQRTRKQTQRPDYEPYRRILDEFKHRCRDYFFAVFTGACWFKTRRKG